MGCLFDMFGGLIGGVVLGRLLNLRPRIRKAQGALVAETAPLAAALTLGLKLRRVVIDPRQRAVRILARYAWLFPKVRHVPFDVVTCVLDGYRDISVGQHLPLTSYQEQDMYTVHLLLRNGERLLLCRFFGQGQFINNSLWPDWMLWEDELIADLTAGPQATEARSYSRAVAALIGVPLQTA